MRAKLTWADLVAFLVWMLPFAYLIYVYPALPERVALHFNLNGEADRLGEKSELVFAVLLLCGTSLFVTLLVRFLPNIDPKKKVKYSQPIFIKIGYALVFFLSALTIAIIYSSLRGRFVLDNHFLYPCICLLLAYFGNLFNNLKPNYFVGIRTPWTLENEEVWKRTHQWGGRLWLGGGLLLGILTFVLPEKASFVCFVSGVLVLALLPVVYSFICFQQIQRKSA
jgi:uncharacterized membrane protein